MKKKTISRLTTTIVGLMAIALLSACSDGSHMQPGQLGSPSVVPKIAKFQISKVGGSDAPGLSVRVEEGDSVLLEWDVGTAAPEAEKEGEETITPKAAEGGEDAGDLKANAPVITITSDLDHNFPELKPSDSKVIENVTADVVFILTAKFGEKDPETRKVTATVKSAALPMTASLTASSPQIDENGSAEICWQVSRSDANISIIDSDGNTIVTPVASEDKSSETEVADQESQNLIDGELDLEEGAEISKSASMAKAAAIRSSIKKNNMKMVVMRNAATEEDVLTMDSTGALEVESSDCVTVHPIKTTTYFLTATATDAKNAKSKVTIVVPPEEFAITEFSVSPKSISREQEVTLTWEVVPEEAMVSFSSDKHTFTLMEVEQPTTGSMQIVVSETTTFEIHASLSGEEPKSKSVTVTLEPKLIAITPTLNNRPLVDPDTGEPVANVEAGTYFEGEKVQIGWDATVDGAMMDGVQVTVSGSDQIYGASENVEIPVSGDGQYTITAQGEGLETSTTTVNVDVRKWISSPDTANYQLSAIAPIPGVTDTALIGYRGDLSKTGDLYIGKMLMEGNSLSTTLLSIPFQSLFESAGSLAGKWNPKFIQNLESFPVNSIAIDEEGRNFVGTSGGIVYTDDSGTTWKDLILTGYVMNEGNYPGEHRACKGFTMDGNSKVEIASLQQVCDIVIDDDGRFYVATSHMVVFLANGVDAYINNSDDPENLWVGMPAAGKEGNMAFNTVNHDLEIVSVDGEKRIYSASDKGLLVSSDGQSWTVDGLTTPVLSVKADTASGKLYVGGEDAMHVRDLSGGEWQKISAVHGPVFDVQVDPVQVGTVYAATDKGIKLSRDKGESWLDITKGSMTGAGVVEAISIAKVSDKVGIYVATDKGLFISVAKVKFSNPVITEPPEEVGVPQADNIPTVGGDDNVLPAADANALAL